MSCEEKLLSMLKGSPKVVGSKQVLRGLSEGTVRCVIVAEDAESKIREGIIRAAENAGAAVVAVPGMVWLGRAVGIEVGAAAVGLTEPEANK